MIIISWRNRNDVTFIHALEQGYKRLIQKILLFEVGRESFTSLPAQTYLSRIRDAVVEALHLWNHRTRAVWSPHVNLAQWSSETQHLVVGGL